MADLSANFMSNSTQDMQHQIQALKAKSYMAGQPGYEEASVYNAQIKDLQDRINAQAQFRNGVNGASKPASNYGSSTGDY